MWIIWVTLGLSRNTDKFILQEGLTDVAFRLFDKVFFITERKGFYQWYIVKAYSFPNYPFRCLISFLDDLHFSSKSMLSHVPKRGNYRRVLFTLQKCTWRICNICDLQDIIFDKKLNQMPLNISIQQRKKNICLTNEVTSSRKSGVWHQFWYLNKVFYCFEERVYCFQAAVWIFYCSRHTK